MAATTMLTMAAATNALVGSPVPQVSFGRSVGAVRATPMSVRAAPGLRMVCMAAPTGSSGPAIDTTGDKVADKTTEAQEICAGDEQSEECATAWDDVEKAAQEKAQSKGKADPLEEFCEENPEADECRVYKD